MSIVRGNCVRETSVKSRNKLVQEITRNVANVFIFYAIIAIKHVFQCVNIRQVPREVFGRGFQHLPRDLANVNAWKTMFDPYVTYLIFVRHISKLAADGHMLHAALPLCTSGAWQCYESVYLSVCIFCLRQLVDSLYANEQIYRTTKYSRLSLSWLRISRSENMVLVLRWKSNNR